MKKKALIFCVFLFVITLNKPVYSNGLQYKNFNIKDIVFSKYNNAFKIYDFIFPVLVRFYAINDNDTDQEKIVKTIKFINFYSTPGLFTRYKGLGTDKKWWENPSLMLKSGNLYCSEQSSLATLILKIDFRNFALRDVTNHTFHEVLVNNRWIILDPMFDNRILDNKNRLITFDEIQQYLKGNRSILKLPKHISVRTKKYLDLFKKETYKPVRMPFGQHFVFSPESIDKFAGIKVIDFIAILRKNKIDINTSVAYPYLVFIRNNIIKILKNSKNKKQTIYKIQEHFFNKFSLQYLKGWISGEIDTLYIARNYQLLGKFKKSLELLDNMEQNKNILFYKSQIFYKLKDKKNFNKLSQKLKDNIFYRYMYWLLNKRYLLSSDKNDFDKFSYRLIDYDIILMKYGKLILSKLKN